MLFVQVLSVVIMPVVAMLNQTVFKDQMVSQSMVLNMVSTGLTEEKAKRFGFNPAVVESTDLQKAAFMEDENEDVTIKIVYDKDTRKVLGAQMVSRMDISMGIHMFSLAIQEGVTIDRLQLLDLFFLPHFNQPLSYIAKAAISAK